MTVSVLRVFLCVRSLFFFFLNSQPSSNSLVLFQLLPKPISFTCTRKGCSPLTVFLFLFLFPFLSLSAFNPLVSYSWSSLPKLCAAMASSCALYHEMLLTSVIRTGINAHTHIQRGRERQTPTCEHSGTHEYTHTHTRMHSLARTLRQKKKTLSIWSKG